jgi:glycerol-3-phosphate dehydrogenase
MTKREEIGKHYQASPEVSVLIVGGGINGVGLFRELALQGVDVLLVERSDFCSGASAASSRMIHGGLRYLEFGEFRLVREAVRERNLLLQNAPHYVTPLKTTIPIFSFWSGMGSSIARFLGLNLNRPAHRGALMVRLGLSVYDLLTRKHRMTPRHTFSSRKAALEKRPGLNPGLRYTATFYDGLISYPERLGLELIMDGEDLCPEAHALNYVDVQEAADDTVTLRDHISGESFSVRPRTVVNATGAWIDFTNKRLGHATQLIGGTKGAHLVLDNPALFETLDDDMIYYETPDGRVAVVLPWLGKALIGSTDIRIDDPDKIRCTDEEINYIISAVAEAFPKMEINRSQIISQFTGARPLPHSGESTVAVSRDHSCTTLPPSDGIAFPVHSMVGGKWTTFRGFSEEMADRLLGELGRERRMGTGDLPIGGGKDFPLGDAGRVQWITKAAKETALSQARVDALLARYGTRALDVARYMTEEEDSPVTGLPGYSRREIAFMALHEQVAHLEDLVLRRTALALRGDLTQEILAEIAEILAEAVGWTQEERAEELARAETLLRERHSITLNKTTTGKTL